MIMKYLKTFLYLLLFVQLVAAQTVPPHCPDLCTDCVYTNANSYSEWRLGSFNTYEECALEAFKQDCNIANYISEASSDAHKECYCQYGSDRTVNLQVWWQSCFLPSHQMNNKVLGNQLAVGNAHTCVILKHNNLARCWGKNDKGQLGRDNTATWGGAAQQMGDYLWKPFLGTGRTVVKIFSGVGAEHTCALLDDDNLKCWGAADYAQLGLGSTYNAGAHANDMGALPAVNLGTGKTAVSVAMGRKHTCALLNDGNVKCWGYQLNGILGNDQSHDANWGDQLSEMGDNLPNVNLGTGKTAIAIACTRSRTCALLNDGNVKCWGDSEFGGSGYAGKDNVGSGAGNTYGMGDSLPNINLGNDNGKVVSIACGMGHCCVLTNEGRVRCWGANNDGQLGLGTATGGDKFIPQIESDMPPNAVNLGTGKTAVSISAGSEITCAVLNDGTAKCWGVNANGELGYGDTASRGKSPSEMGDGLPAIDLGGVNVTKIVGGEYFTCAVLDNGYLKCWGDNTNGQLGSGDTISRGYEAGDMGNNLPYVNLGDAPWTVCNAGEEITTNGTSSVDRQCGACSNGRFSTTLNQYSCTPWTDCVAGTRISQSGSATTDRQCTACVMPSFTSSANQQTCSPYSNVDDLTCTAGEMIQHATTTSDVQCVACPNGQFQTATNQYFCTDWTTCANGEKIKQGGSATSDQQCEACPSGKFTTATNQQTCVSHTTNITCAAGEKIQNGTAISDSKCVSCLNGGFTPTSNQLYSCFPWTTNCNAGQKITQSRSATRDRQCGSCDQGKFTSTANQQSCLGWTICSIGQKITQNGTISTDRQCVECSDGFTKTTNQHTCSPWTNCLAGEQVKQNPGPAVDRQCKVCEPGKFTSTSNALSCSDWSYCNPGKFAVEKANSTSDYQCMDCALGSFTKDENHFESCSPWTNCTDGKKEMNAPTSSADRLCGMGPEAKEAKVSVAIRTSSIRSLIIVTVVASVTSFLV